MDLHEPLADAHRQVWQLFKQVGLDGQANTMDSVFTYGSTFPEEGVPSGGFAE